MKVAMKQLSPKQLARISLLAAVSVALRFSFVAFPNVKPITALFFVAVLYLGLLEGFLIMATTMLVTGFFLGFGPVVFWQILSFALVMGMWHLIQLGSWSPPLGVQTILSALLVLIFGWLMSCFAALQFGVPLLPYWINGLFFDGLHAVSTFLFYPLIHSIFRRFYHEKNRTFL